MQSIRSTMSTPPRGLSRNAKVVIASVLAVVLVSSGIAVGVRAEDIPHENYDLVGSNLDFVISLLNTSISYSEGALMAMYNQTMADVNANLTIVSNVFVPAARLLDEIKDVAESYGNLSYLLPSFASLSSQMGSFASMETVLIADRDTIISASHLQNLSGSELVAAWEAINRINSLMHAMNGTIDDMLVSANTTIALVVDGRQPFTDNELVPLIEKLRDLLYIIDLQIDELIHNDVPWSHTEPFLLLWLSESQYYLGEEILGGGHLYYDGAFATNHLIQIAMDGVNLTSIRTDGGGKFQFTYLTPIDAGWLGSHDMQAHAETVNGTLNSSAVGFTIVLIPTNLGLVVSPDLISPPETATATTTLKDINGNQMPNAPCHMILDGENITFATDAAGRFEQSWLGFDLGYGSHSIQAFYEGELPYAPAVSGAVSVVVNIPTDIEVTLLTSRVYTGYFLVVNGSLKSNGSAALPGFEVTLLIDGIEMANLTTDSLGEFEMSIPTEDMQLGGHTLTAAFLHREYIWRYSEDSVSFTLYASKQGDYPFFPSIPGWGGLSPPGDFAYLFIGSNAYYFWLLVLVLIGVSIRVLQTRKARAKALENAKAEMLVPLGIVPALPSAPVPSVAEFTDEISAGDKGPATPNERIIWYYQRLLAFLARRDSISLRSSMTHWEVARLLKNIGYPNSPVDNATILFEKAFYSEDKLTDTDTVQMSSTLTNILGSKKAVV
jgi:hypothetical protein